MGEYVGQHGRWKVIEVNKGVGKNVDGKPMHHKRACEHQCITREHASINATIQQSLCMIATLNAETRISTGANEKIATLNAETRITTSAFKVDHDLNFSSRSDPLVVFRVWG